MRVGFVYPNTTTSKYAWAADAMRAIGNDVEHLKDIAQLSDASSRCDLIIVAQKGGGLNRVELAAAIRECPCPTVQWWFDLIALNGRPLAESPFTQGAGGDLMRAFDVIYVKEADRIEEYKSLGITAEWLDQGCPSWMPATTHHDDPEFDVLIYGTYSNSYWQRVSIAQKLASRGYRVAWASRQSVSPIRGIIPIQFTLPAALPELASRSRFTLCVDVTNAEPGYWSDRIWLAMGMGAVAITNSTPLFPAPHDMYLEHHRASGLTEQLRLHNNTDARKEIGKAAREYVMTNHTYEVRCKEIIQRCKQFTAAGSVTYAGFV